MMKRLSALLTALMLAVCLLLPFADTAHAADLDYIHRYDVTVTPNADDGSLLIRLDFRWEVLDEGPVTWLQIGVPNGSIRDVQALSDNIDELDYDNSYMYVYFDREYDDGEVFDFSYSWVQEYMYTLPNDGTVSYNYTPGWFDGARIGEMTVTWNAPQGAALASMGSSADSKWTEQVIGSSYVFTGTDLGHGETLTVLASYQNWPAELYWEYSSENLPQDDYYYDDYYDDYDYTAEVISMAFTVIVMVIVIIIVVNVVAGSSYRGGFGTPRYVCWHGLWYPAGFDGRPKPGSVGTKTKPKTPPRTANRRSGGGFGGGSRGGGFGGGGFGGGSHCACASSCACACACACAGGGRAGCSAKNLYGAVQLSRELTEKLMDK